MSELPDVEIFRRRFDNVATGERITEAKVKDARLLDGISARELKRRLLGRRIRSTERHGKHLIAALDDCSALVLHFVMTGTIGTRGSNRAGLQGGLWRTLSAHGHRLHARHFRLSALGERIDGGTTKSILLKSLDPTGDSHPGTRSCSRKDCHEGLECHSHGL